LNGPIEELKAELRRKVRAKLRRLTATQQVRDSEQACRLLEEQAVWQNARALLFYAPLPGELDLWPLLALALQSGKAVCLPKFEPGSQRYQAHLVKNLSTDLVPGKFSIREPAVHCPQLPLNRLDFVLVPGVAFDEYGRRLGRGKGFYDQILAAVRGKTCGVAFDEQIVEEVPVAPRDIIVNCILTPSRWLQP
jgi:5-formyltetrahydrofolate cyclo-ligase